MSCTNAVKFGFPCSAYMPSWQLLAVFFLTLILGITISAQNSVALNDNVLTVDEVKDTEIFALGKTVIIKKEAKGVLVFGGDIIIEGKVDGDVATIGGSIYQKEDAYIGGDVIIFGGKYIYERKEPLRNPEKDTIMYAGYEEELRNLMQNPSHLLSPSLTWTYVVQRILSTLFWFIASLILVTISPGAISRSVTRFHLSTSKVVGIGLLSFITVTIGVIMGFSFLPSYVSGIIGVMAIILLIVTYVFGHVTLQVSFGKWLQKLVLKEHKHSESVTLLLGAFAWTLITSIPYLGTLAVVLLFSVSLGLIVTLRSNSNWKKIS